MRPAARLRPTNYARLMANARAAFMQRDDPSLARQGLAQIVRLRRWPEPQSR